MKETTRLYPFTCLATAVAWQELTDSYILDVEVNSVHPFGSPFAELLSVRKSVAGHGDVGVVEREEVVQEGRGHEAAAD
jgi:hypothetical protein